MMNMPLRHEKPSPQRIASCGCQHLKLTIVGEPRRVYACACRECQRATGSAFACRAIFASEAILSVEGESRVWRRGSDSGRWVEQVFCPVCGGLVYMRAQAMPGAISISVGSFADPDFPAPVSAHNAAGKPGWYRFADEVAIA